jgi:CBS domain containing-hemolysin-like protein
MIGRGDIGPWVIWLLVFAGFETLDALYSGMETGVYLLNKVRLDLHAEAGGPQARLLRRLLRQFDKLLAVLLLGTNISRFMATFAISVMFVMGGAGRHAEWYTMLVATPALFVIGDAVPKQVFQRLSGRAVYALSGLLRVSEVLLTWTGLLPLVRGISGLMLRLAHRRGGAVRPLEHAGLHAVIAEGRASGLLTQFQSVMAERVVRIAGVTCRDVMIPLSKAAAASCEVSGEQLAGLIQGHDFSRLPMLDEAGQVAGILDIYDVLAAEEPRRPRQAMTPPTVLPGDMPVTDALYQMQRAHAAMAVIADDGRHVGIVTLKDLVEEIVGELAAW